MDIRATTQDAFFGELDDLDAITTDDRMSTRTLVAESTSPTSRDDIPGGETRYTNEQISAGTGHGVVHDAAHSSRADKEERAPFTSPLPLDASKERTTSTTDPYQSSSTWHPTLSSRSSQQTLVAANQNDGMDSTSAPRGYGNPRPAFMSFNPTSDSSEVERLQETHPSSEQFATGEQDSIEIVSDRIPGTAFADYMTDAETRRFTESMRQSLDNEAGHGSNEHETTEQAYHMAPDDDTLKTAMSFIDFLPHDPLHLAKLVIVTEDDGTFNVDGLDLAVLEEQCLLLAIGFERNTAGILKNSLEARSRHVAVSFLRFLYTDSYLITADDGASLIPSSLLFHVDMYQMAEIFDLTSLKKQAQANITRVSEFADCYPSPITDLCEASRFIYSKLAKHVNLIEIVQHYCVNCFRRHNLKDNLSFCKLVEEVPLFGLDLLKTNIERGFQDEGAADIIQLPIHTAPRVGQLAAEQQALIDFVYDIWGPQTFASRCGEDSTASSTISSPRLAGYALVRRPKVSVATDDSEASASEAEGFTLVHRPRPLKRRDVPDSADEADISDWSDTVHSNDEEASPRRRRRLATKSSATTIRPPPRSCTPTQANPDPTHDDLFDSSDAGFSVMKSHEQSTTHPDEPDDFELL